MFAAAAGTELAQGNVRRRVLDKAIERANEKLIEADDVPLPDGLTPHKLRHTFASILVALGVDPGSVMDQLGHADPGFTLRVYRHGMRRDRTAKERLRALVGGADWAPSATATLNRRGASWPGPAGRASVPPGSTALVSEFLASTTAARLRAARLPRRND